MRKITFFLVTLLLGAGLQSKAQSHLNMKGAYSMTKQIGNDGNKDSMMKKEQLKIYTGKYMMYASPHAGDSLADYGIGTYRIKNGKLLEDVFYTSYDGDKKDTYELAIHKNGKGYTQIIAFKPEAGSSSGTFTLTEDYVNVGKPVTTPLDGAWKQTKTLYVTNGDTITRNDITQFKIYESGHFIWANTYFDSATQKPASSYGYGSFQMQGANKSVEVNNSSTYKTALVKKPVTLLIEFMGKDAYKQTIVYPGWKHIELYQRLK